MKYIKILPVAALALSLFATSCIDDDVNVNPDEATEEMMQTDNLKAGSYFRQMIRSIAPWHNAEGNIASGDYEITQAFNYDALGGYVACLHSNREWNSLYAFRDQARNALFSTAFTRVMAPWNDIHKLAVENKLTTLDALATIAKVAGMHRAADTFGSIPYASFGTSSLYDPLDETYAKFFEELDYAIETLTTAINAGSTTTLEDYDIVYGGNIQKWVRFANTLRLRLALRCSYVDPTLGRTQAQKAMDCTAGFIESKDDRFAINHDLYAYAHPYIEITGWNEAAPAASIMAYMNGYEDPRRSVYFTRSTNTNEYNGVRVGLNTNNVSPYTNNGNLSKLNVDNKTSIVLMYAAESFFLRAEAALRGWIAGDVADLYASGVRTSFEERDAGSADAYLNSDNTPGAFNDVVASNNATINSTITPKWDDSADFETKLERIITQKWIAMYLEGCEAWSEYRRTGYPKLLPVVSNASGGTIDDNIGARRIPYSDEEYITNADGVASGISHLGGPDNGGTKVWWDKK